MCKKKTLMSLTHIIKTFENTADVRQIKTLLSKHSLNHLAERRLTQCPRQFQHPNKKTKTVQSIWNWTHRDSRRAFQTPPQRYWEASDTWATVLTPSQILSVPIYLCLWRDVPSEENPVTRTSVPRPGSRGSSRSCETSRSRLTRRELQMNTIWPKASSTNA